MTDNDYIIKFLDKTYDVRNGALDFYLVDKEQGEDEPSSFSTNTISPVNFGPIFYDLFGKYTTSDGEDSIEIFNRWFDAKKKLLLTDFFNYLDNIDDSIGGDNNLDNILDYFADSSLSDSFISMQFIQFYNRKFMNQKISDYIEKIDINKGYQYYLHDIRVFFYKDHRCFNVTIFKKFDFGYRHMLNKMMDKYLSTVPEDINSVDMFNHFKYRLQLDGVDMMEYIHRYLNDWYLNNKLYDKVDYFLSQLVITLGSSNWVVTWVGHGVFTKEKILNYFTNEDKYHEEYIMHRYNEWYEQAVIDKSEKIMKNTY